jgi:hypothetical protein
VGRFQGSSLPLNEKDGFDQHGWGFGMAVVTKTDDLWRSPGSFGWEWRSRYVEDPVYLAQPAQWSGKWEYRPTMRHSNQKCDVEVARKFLQQ